MIKIDLAREISERMNISLKQADQFLNTFVEVTAETLGKGEKVQLAGFGTFGTRQVAARTGRNPKTGESLEVPAAIYPHFRPGKTLKEKVMPLSEEADNAQGEIKKGAKAKAKTNKAEKETETKSRRKPKSKTGSKNQPVASQKPEIKPN